MYRIVLHDDGTVSIDDSAHIPLEALAPWVLDSFYLLRMADVGVRIEDHGARMGENIFWIKEIAEKAEHLPLKTCIQIEDANILSGTK